MTDTNIRINEIAYEMQVLMKEYKELKKTSKAVEFILFKSGNGVARIRGA